MSAVVRWEEPPPARRARRWKQAADELRERPGEWALLAEGLSENIAHSAQRNLAIHGVKVARRKIDGVGYAVWAMAPAVAGETQ